MPPFNAVPYATRNFNRPHPGAGVLPVLPQTGIPSVLKAPDGQLYVNPRKSSEKWNWITAPCSATALAATIAANGQLQIGATPGLEQGSLGDAEYVKMIATATGRFATQIYDPFLDRKYSNQPVAMDLMWGAAAELPAVLFESIFSPAATTLQLSLTDLSGAENTIRMDFSGRRFLGCGPRVDLFNAFRSRRTHPYWLTFDQGPQVAIAASTTTRLTMTVPADCDFEAWSLMDDTTVNSTGAPAEYEIRILEGTSGRSMLGVPNGLSVPISLVAAKSRDVTGVAGGRLRAVGNPFIMTFSHLFQRTTQIQIDIVNTNAFQIDARLAFHGRALYTPGKAPAEMLHLLEAVTDKPTPRESQGAPPAAPQAPIGAPAPSPGYSQNQYGAGALQQFLGPQAGWGYGAGQGR